MQRNSFKSGHRNDQDRRRGAAAVELALVLLFLMMLTVGMLQFAMVFLVRHGMLHACREGARYYGKHDTTAAQAVSRSEEVLAELFTGTYTDGTQYADDFTVSSSTSGTDREITISIPSSTEWVSFADVFGFLDSYPTIASTVTFRDEGNY